MAAQRRATRQRDAEALDMLSAMASGHAGSLSTVHAGSPDEALRRVETLALMADVALPHAAVRELVAGAIDLVVQQRRERDGRRRIVAVSEVLRGADGVATRELFSWRDGRACWRVPLPEALAARLADAPVADEATGAPACADGSGRPADEATGVLACADGSGRPADEAASASPADPLARLEAARRRLRASVAPLDESA